MENLYTETNTAINDDEISLKEVILKLKEWWQYLLSKWVIIVAAGIIGGALGFTYALFQKPQYTARLTFALEEDKGGGIGGAYAGLASQFGIDLGGAGGGVFSGDNLLELMKSRSMIERTLLSEVEITGKKQTLADYYIAINKLKEAWATKPELMNINFLVNTNRSMFTRVQDSVLNTITESLKKSFSVDKTDKKLSIIAVTCKSENELFSKYFTESLVETVTDFYTKTKTGRSAKNVAILQSKADSLRNEMNRAMYGRPAAVDQTLNLNPARQTGTVPTQRKTVDIQVLSTAYGEVVKNLEISKMGLMRDTPLIQVIDEPILPLGKEKFGKLRGLILGGILAGFLTITGLLGRKIIASVIE